MRTVVFLLALPLVAARATSSTMATRVIDTACSWVKPITASPTDTFETKQQILAHDLAVAKNCPNATVNGEGSGELRALRSLLNRPQRHVKDGSPCIIAASTDTFETKHA